MNTVSKFIPKSRKVKNAHGICPHTDYKEYKKTSDGKPIMKCKCGIMGIKYQNNFIEWR